MIFLKIKEKTSENTKFSSIFIYNTINSNIYSVNLFSSAKISLAFF